MDRIRNFIPYPPNLLFLLYSVSESEIGHWFTLWTSESLSISLLSSWQKPTLSSSPVTHLFPASPALNPCLWLVPTPGALPTLLPTKQSQSWYFPNQSSRHEELGIVPHLIRLRKFSFISNFKKIRNKDLLYSRYSVSFSILSWKRIWKSTYIYVFTYVCMHMHTYYKSMYAECLFVYWITLSYTWN